MSATIHPIGRRKPQSFGTVWLDTIERDDGPFQRATMERGRAYALHDWQLEVDIEPGRAEALARSGPRIQYRAAVTAAPLSDDEWDRVLATIAGSSARTAALYDGELLPELLDDARAAGVELVPAASTIETTCTCRNWGELCKHVAAVVYMLGDAFDEDPFDLLLWRGLSTAEAIERVRRLRSSPEGDGQGGGEDQASSERGGDGLPPGSSGDGAADRGADSLLGVVAWAWDPQPLPTPLPTDLTPGSVPALPSDPPRRAPFTATGLRLLAETAVRRAHGLVRDGQPSFLDLEPVADLGRLAAELENTDDWGLLVAGSGRTSQNLSARAGAWRVAGADGVAALDDQIETVRVDERTQIRRASDGRWWRFEKPAGRWLLTAGPADERDELLRR